MRSHQDTVESKIKHINNDSRLLGYFKDNIAKEQLKSKVLEQSLSRMTGKLRITMEENCVMRERVKEHHLRLPFTRMKTRWSSHDANEAASDVEDGGNLQWLC
ncbi:hypothetical protein HN51_029012 [Arachis hypogaea]